VETTVPELSNSGADSGADSGASVSADVIVDVENNPLHDQAFRAHCKELLDAEGALVLPGFLREQVITSVQQEAAKQQSLAYYTQDKHNIYLTPPNPSYPRDHPRNRNITSTKGCITHDQVPKQSALRALYNSIDFKTFLCAVLGEDALYEYADALASINVHYASHGQELGWHYDNSAFAITLLIQAPEAGGQFEYVPNVRHAESADMNFEMSSQVLDGAIKPKQLTIDAGSLVLFRGRNSMHRVTPTQGETVRMLVVLAYNTEPNIALSESARMTFFGRLS